jgi:lysophospholipase L1-like esterase
VEFFVSDISKIDSNFNVPATIQEAGLRFFDAMQPPFVIYGVFYANGKFRRMPEAVAKTVSNGVYNLHARTAGGRVRFRTDSNYVAIHAEMSSVGKMSHMPMSGSAGFDLYVREETERYMGTFTPPVDMDEGFESIIYFNSPQMREITINFPLYSEVSSLHIGVNEGAALCSPQPYDVQTPIVFYGSSITQGGCASRPGNAYTSIVSRRFHADYINLGFAGNAKAEPEIAEYVKQLDMSVFVYDYDYNARKVEYLRDTHEKMFRVVREANPDLPIILMSRPKFYLNEKEEMRLEIIKTTYRNAIESGDKNVYLIEGKKLMDLAGNEGTVDTCHPNDLGFYSMAKAVGDVLEKILDR